MLVVYRPRRGESFGSIQIQRGYWILLDTRTAGAVECKMAASEQRREDWTRETLRAGLRRGAGAGLDA
eukprot:scaffold313185_cov31-Tisochrysis_lutea.AAC.1